MLMWETDPSVRESDPGAAFADAGCATPKVVLSRTLKCVQGNARLAETSIAKEHSSFSVMVIEGLCRAGWCGSASSRVEYVRSSCEGAAVRKR